MNRAHLQLALNHLPVLGTSFAFLERKIKALPRRLCAALPVGAATIRTPILSPG